MSTGADADANPAAAYEPARLTAKGQAEALPTVVIGTRVDAVVESVTEAEPYTAYEPSRSTVKVKADVSTPTASEIMAEAKADTYVEADARADSSDLDEDPNAPLVISRSAGPHTGPVQMPHTAQACFL